MIEKSRINELPVKIIRRVEADTSEKKPGDPCDVPKFRGTLLVKGMGKRLFDGGAWNEQRLIPRLL